MRSLLFAQMSERCYSQEDIGLIINTPVFQVLLFAIDRTGPRFWFFAFAGLQVTLFALITWATADRYYGGGTPRRQCRLRQSLRQASTTVSKLSAGAHQCAGKTANNEGREVYMWVNM